MNLLREIPAAYRRGSHTPTRPLAYRLGSFARQTVHTLDRYDSIIVGAGHNGLACAANLAQSGQRMLVLEASDAPGGWGLNFESPPVTRF